MKFRVDAMVRPYLLVQFICCFIDTQRNMFGYALIGVFQASLHIRPSYCIVYLKYDAALEEPYIYDLLKAYILLVGFDMSINSCII